MENNKKMLALFEEIRQEFHISADSEIGYKMFLLNMWFNFIQ